MTLPWNLNIKKDRKNKSRRVDVVKEQVKKILTDADQKLILMVRG